MNDMYEGDDLNAEDLCPICTMYRPMWCSNRAWQVHLDICFDHETQSLMNKDTSDGLNS